MMDARLKHKLSQDREKTLKQLASHRSQLLVLVPRRLHPQCLCPQYPPIHPFSVYSLIPDLLEGHGCCCTCICFCGEAEPALVGILALSASSFISCPVIRAQWQVTRLHHDPHCSCPLQWSPIWGLIAKSTVPGAREDTACFFWRSLKPLREGCGQRESWCQTFSIL